MSKQILVVVAHADDEAIGCGGFIYDVMQRGDKVDIALTMVREDKTDKSFHTLLRDTFESSCRRLGATPVFLDVIGERGDIHELLPILEGQFRSRPYDTVITHFRGDMHYAHRKVHEAVSIVVRPFRLNYPLQFLEMEILSSTDQTPYEQFNPNLYVTISKEAMAAKIGALNLYTTEVEKPRDEEALVGLARMRGGTIGREFAESFIIRREVQ
jgi:LmbE family N-acetylglucosaminyl deacetylase